MAVLLWAAFAFRAQALNEMPEGFANEVHG